MPSSLVLGFVSALNDTDGQVGTVGAAGVAVGVGVDVGVKVRVDVDVGVKVRVGIDVGGMGLFVRVGAGTGVDVLGPFEGVHEGITKPVLVGGNVGNGMGVRV
jgi:hypothetical protein